MKIEIDFNKPEELYKMRRELEMALSTIDGAIQAIKRNAVDPAQPALLPEIEVEHSNKAEDEKQTVTHISETGLHTSAIFSKLPNEFTMRDALTHPEAQNFADSRVRSDIATLIETGWIEVIEAGAGRRPTRFRKT